VSGPFARPHITRMLRWQTLSDALYQPFPMATKARGQIWHHVPATRKPRHFHAEPELNLVTRGTGAFAMGDKVLRVVPGDLLWWPPGQDHMLAEASPDFDLFVIGVTADFSSRVLLGTREVACAGPIQLRLAPPELAEITAACAAVRNATDLAVIERQVGDLWRRAHALRGVEGSMHSVTRRTMASLYERPELARSEVARLVRAYPTEVSRCFHDDMGMTLTAFRSRLRLLRFIEAVDDGAENLLTAALGAGFGSYSQCHRVFQRTFGCTPRLFFETSLRDQMRDALEPWEPLAEPALRLEGAGLLLTTASEPPR
jgi:AraC-like DNA-binding protein/mannose-6-phosphate isomerase-like protein (cupin superfamily)